METKNFDDLKANQFNPRSISKQDFESLKVSLNELGDLGVITYNVRLGRLVTGHQRLESFRQMPGEKKVVITQRFEPVKKDGTVAIGFVVHNENFYAYREVDFDEAKDLAACIASNRISGSFDLVALADVNKMIKDLDQDLLKLTGQSDDELKKLEQLSSEPESESDGNQSSDDADTMTFKFTTEQAEIVNEALGNILTKHEVADGSNMDIRANAIVFMAKTYLEQLHRLQEAQNAEPQPAPQV